MEKTFALIKPDGVEGKLIGEILSRFERISLEIEALKMVQATPDIAARHYSHDEDWLVSMGNKVLQTYQRYNLDIIEEINTDEPLELGRLLEQWASEHITSGPVVVMILSGDNSVGIVRKLVGDTIPLDARPGTIRGDLSSDSSDIAIISQRSIYNIIHASDSTEEAQREIRLWF